LAYPSKQSTHGAMLKYVVIQLATCRIPQPLKAVSAPFDKSLTMLAESGASNRILYRFSVYIQYVPRFSELDTLGRRRGGTPTPP